MKHKILLCVMTIFLTCVGIVCMSCESDSPQPSVEPTPGYPDALLTIVRFDNPEQANNVILQHPFKDYKLNLDEALYHYEYYENVGLYLNVLLDQYPDNEGYRGVEMALVNWADEHMHIAGTSPYIPLTDGYYLIDWKWHQLHPLSALAQSAENELVEHLSEHCFMTNIPWEDLTDLTAEHDTSNTSLLTNEVEVVRIPVTSFIPLYGEDINPYICYNWLLYYDEGMCYQAPYAYYRYGDCSSNGRTYQDVILFCDSLQTVYQQRLIDMIRNDKLKDPGLL